jgi:hypothetical protein
MYLKKFGIYSIIILLLAACGPVTPVATTSAPSSPIATVMPSEQSSKATPAANEPTTPKKTKLAPTQQSVESFPKGNEPYPDAPLCPDSGAAHDNNLFHTLWDSTRRCHYDHEHGQNPFTAEVAATFPGFDLQALMGGVGIGHTNPSSEMENTHKHGGFKWDVTLSHSGGCVGGEGASVGVDAAVIQYHAFGDYSIEMEARIHSAMALLRQCLESNPADFGYVFVNQHQDYGQRVSPYQGNLLNYPDTPGPAYKVNLKPYFTIDCTGGVPPCDKYPTLQSYIDRNVAADSLWVSQPLHLDDSGSPLFGILFKVRDTYQVLDWNDQEYPYTFLWLCSTDGGKTYDPAGCRYNNTTTRVQQVAGEIPAVWDNLDGFDTDTRKGRISADGYVTRFGELNQSCTAAGPDCQPIKLVQAFVGTYGSLFYNKQETKSLNSQPDRDIYFCNGQLCSESDSSAVPSGWLGPSN